MIGNHIKTPPNVGVSFHLDGHTFDCWVVDPQDDGSWILKLRTPGSDLMVFMSRCQFNQLEEVVTVARNARRECHSTNTPNEVKVIGREVCSVTQIQQV
jgi:hypothetical protein